ncbi:MAG: hypothetical protein M0007_01885 [Actinomycetota bacterium]|nr:hypothetical protein [Actinomycetota bacterium]
MSDPLAGPTGPGHDMATGGLAPGGLAGYPPEDHFLRDLDVTVELRADGTARGTIPVGPDTLVAGGWPRAGIVGVLVDSVAGAAAVMTARPDRVATADMTLHLFRPLTGPEVAVEASVMRRGRTTVVIEATVTDGAVGGPLGWATLTFALLAARAHQTPPGDAFRLTETVRTAFGGRQSGRSVLERIGWGPDGRQADMSEPAGDLVDLVHLEVDEYVRNTFGAVQGGIVALLADEAARRAAPGTVVADLHLAFLAPCKVGPIVGRARLLEPPGVGAGAVLVELRDAGAGGRVTTVADAGVVVPAATVGR